MRSFGTCIAIYYYELAKGNFKRISSGGGKRQRAKLHLHLEIELTEVVLSWIN